jgi:glycosyltransferase involved in cell wall biosynthesis
VTRTLVLGLHYPPHHVGGYEVSCRDVVDRLAARGHELVVLTSNLRVPGVADPPLEQEARPPVWRDLTPWFYNDDLYAPGLPTRRRIERRNQAALVAVLDRYRPEVVSVWQMGALSLGLLTTIARRGIPIVYAVSDDWLSYAPQMDAWSRLFARVPRRLTGPVERLLGVPVAVPDLGCTGSFCFISEDTRTRARDHAPWTLEHTSIVYSGIDGSLFGDGPATEDATGDATAPPWTGRLLYVGRYDPRKGIETAIRALVHLPEASTLEVQGTGDLAERDRLAAVAAEVGVAGRVTFGAVDRRTLVDRYRAADALVFPSEWAEPFGLTPLEAMACGTPVVATGVGGSGEYLLDGRTCVRFAPGDARSLAVAVDRLAGDPALRARLVEQGRRAARVFDVDRLADVFEAWHTAAANRFRDGCPPSRSFVEELADVGG